MGIDPKNNDVFQLLKKLKEDNGAYPQELLVLRRQDYLKQVAEIIGGAGLALGLRNTVKSGKGAALPPVSGTLLEGLLMIAIVAEASTVAYFYRDKVSKFFQSFSNKPKVEQIILPPTINSPILQLTLSPAVSETITVTETHESIPSLLAEQPTDQPNESSSAVNGGETGGSQTQTVSTAVPNSNSNSNNGNQYGHTPIPDRTKEPGNNSSGNPDSQSDPKKKK